MACHFLSVPFGISEFLVFYILVWYIWSNAKIQGTHHRVIPWALSSPTWVCLLSNFQAGQEGAITEHMGRVLLPAPLLPCQGAPPATHTYGSVSLRVRGEAGTITAVSGAY